MGRAHPCSSKPRGTPPLTGWPGDPGFPGRPGLPGVPSAPGNPCGREEHRDSTWCIPALPDPPVPQAELVLGVQGTAQAGLVSPGDPPSSLGEEERGTKSNKKSLHGNVPVPRDTRSWGCSNWGYSPCPPSFPAAQRFLLAAPVAPQVLGGQVAHGGPGGTAEGTGRWQVVVNACSPSALRQGLDRSLCPIATCQQDKGTRI